MACLMLLLTAAQGCNTSGCTENQNSLPLAGLYTTGADGRPQAVTIDSLEVGGVGAPGDSLLYGSGMELSQVYLPLRSTATSTSFFFHYTQEAISSDALNDTITLSYTSSPYFASEECGAVYYYHIDKMSYTRHLIDSVAIVDSLITNTDVERMKIFFRTESSTETL